MDDHRVTLSGQLYAIQPCLSELLMPMLSCVLVGLRLHMQSGGPLSNVRTWAGTNAQHDHSSACCALHKKWAEPTASNFILPQLSIALCEHIARSGLFQQQACRVALAGWAQKVGASDIAGPTHLI